MAIFRTKNSQELADGYFVDVNPSSYNTIYSVGNRTDIIKCSFNNISKGDITELINGSNSNTLEFKNASNGIIKFEFNEKICLTGFTWYQSNNTSHGTWQVEALQGENLWIKISDTFTLGGNNTSIYTFENKNFYNQYRLFQINGSSSTSPWIQEIEFNCSTYKLHEGEFSRDYRNDFGFLIKKRSLSELYLNIAPNLLMICPNNCTNNTSNLNFEIICSGIASNDEAHAAWHAFDDNRSTTWAAEKTDSGWVGWGTTQNQRINVKAYQLKGRDDYSQCPTSWNLEGSNNAKTWDIIDTKTNMGTYILSQPRLFLLPTNNKFYKFHRINVLSAQNHCSLTLVQAWHNADCQIDLPLINDTTNVITGENYPANNITFSMLDGQRCAIFNGTNSYINLGRNVPFNQYQMTIECLVYINEFNNNSRIFSKTESGAFSIELKDNESSALFYVNNSYIYVNFDTNELPIKKWFHIISTYTGTKCALYINNKLIQSVNAAGEIANNNAYLLLGAEPTNTGIDNSTKFFNGGIKNFKIFTYGFNESDVEKAYNKVAEICK